MGYACMYNSTAGSQSGPAQWRPVHEKAAAAQRPPVMAKLHYLLAILYNLSCLRSLRTVACIHVATCLEDLALPLAAPHYMMIAYIIYTMSETSSTAGLCTWMRNCCCCYCCYSLLCVLMPLRACFEPIMFQLPGCYRGSNRRPLPSRGAL